MVAHWQRADRLRVIAADYGCGGERAERGVEFPYARRPAARVSPPGPYSFAAQQPSTARSTTWTKHWENLSATSNVFECRARDRAGSQLKEVPMLGMLALMAVTIAGADETSCARHVEEA